MAANTNALVYNSYIEQIGILAVTQTALVSGVMQFTDPPPQGLIPQMLNYAELRIQRDMDLLPLQVTKTFTLPSGQSVLGLSVDDFVTVQTILAAGVPLVNTSKEFIQNVAGPTATMGPPAYFAMLGGDAATGGSVSNNILFGPPSDLSYALSIVGTIRAPSLNQFNTAPQAGSATTFISTYLPDLLLQASMIYIAEFQRNFSKISDDPAMAMTYEQQYQLLLASAVKEEFRKKFQESAWTSMSTPVAATQGR